MVMSTTVISAVIAFAAGILVAYINGSFVQRNERRKRLADLASAAFIDAMKAVTENATLNTIIRNTRISETERTELERGLIRSISDFDHAKIRFATYGNAEANRYLVATGGKFLGTSPESRKMLANVILALRAEMGFVKNDLSQDEVSTIIYGDPSESV